MIRSINKLKYGLKSTFLLIVFNVLESGNKICDDLVTIVKLCTILYSAGQWSADVSEERSRQVQGR